MQIKVNKLKKSINSELNPYYAVVIFLDGGNIVHEERFNVDSNPVRNVVWSGKYDKHEAVVLDGEFEYELILDESKDQSALASLLDKPSGELVKAPIKKRGANKDVQ